MSTTSVPLVDSKSAKKRKDKVEKRATSPNSEITNNPTATTSNGVDESPYLKELSKYV